MAILAKLKLLELLYTLGQQVQGLVGFISSCTLSLLSPAPTCPWYSSPTAASGFPAASRGRHRRFLLSDELTNLATCARDMALSDVAQSQSYITVCGRLSAWPRRLQRAISWDELERGERAHSSGDRLPGQKRYRLMD